jgi:hypothetical protein
MIHAFNGEGLYLQNSKKLQVFNNTLVGGHKGGRFDDIDSVFMLNNIFFQPQWNRGCISRSDQQL